MQFRIFYFFILILILPWQAHAESPVSHNVLYLNSYHTGFGWSDRIEQGFKETLYKEHPEANVYYERLDSKRFPLEIVQPSLIQSIKDKYSDITFDAIVVSDDNAFNFALMLREELLPAGTPIFFSGVNNESHPAILRKDALTGVLENIDIKGLIELIQEVHPNLDHIAIVGDSTETGQIHAQNTVDILHQYFADLNYSVHTSWTMRTLAEELQRLPKNTAIVELAFHRDKNGNYLTFEDERYFLENQADVPAYSLWDNRIGFGVLGGLMTAGYVHGEQAAKLLIGYYGGIGIDDLPVIEQIPFPKFFDHNLMVRFGLGKKDLPDDAEILNFPDTFWYRYREYMIWAAIFVTAQTILIMLLIKNIFVRREAQKSLQALNNELEERIAQRTQALSDALDDLKETQGKLVESEKMAALGGLVSGMAHRLNTPIGICTTAESILREKLSKTADPEIDETLDLLESNLNNLASFIQEFKQISINMASESLELIDIKSHVLEIISCRREMLEKAQIDVRVNCEKDLQVKTYPDSLFKILFIFIQNSVLHGFRNPQDHRLIEIIISSNDENWHLNYRDNGAGIAEENRPKIFEPFFTTKFGLGNAGLGLNIAYNEVTHRLQGDIFIDTNWTQGFGLILTLPKNT